LVLKNIITLLIFSQVLFAQDLITDRPDQTESAVTVPLHSLQIETGFVLEKLKENKISVDNYSIAGTLFRYGLTDKIELRFGAGYLINKTDVTNSSFGNFLLGAKVNFVTEEQAPFDLGLLLHMALPIGNKNLNPTKFEPELIAALSSSVSDRLSVSANFGGFNDGSFGKIVYIYTGAIGLSLYDELSTFIEVYGNFSSAISPIHNFDGGFTYLVNDELQLDLSAGKSVRAVSTSWFVSSGISVRFSNI
jgi:hypothetical protein